MINRIFKYQLTEKYCRISIPENAMILSVQHQKEFDTVVLWVKVDPEANEEYRYFRLFETGEEIHYSKNKGYGYLNTIQLDSGLVYHVFEVFKRD